MNSSDPASGPKPPPDLPKRLVNLEPVVIIGSLVWVFVLAGTLVMEKVLHRDAGVWPMTAIAGIALGFVGLGVIGLQRRASRRGDRGSTPNL